MTISPEHFERLTQLVETEAAIKIHPGKEYLVESRMAPLAKELGYASSEAMLDVLFREPSPDLQSRVVEAMTTNETSFFRDRLPFDMMVNTVVPRLIEEKQKERAIQIWCAASSTGQEPYSIAMSLLDNFPVLSSWNVKILATDLSQEVLTRARGGSYSQLEVNRGLPAPMLVKHFDRDGVRWRVKPELQRMVVFRQLNLIRPWRAMPECDVVFIRNVLIYFEQDVKRKILKGVSDLMPPGGALFMGAAETTLGLSDAFKRVSVDGGSYYECVREVTERCR